MNLHHYTTARTTPKMRQFWGERGLSEQSEANQREILVRADMLIDGLEMLLPTGSEAQKKLQQEAILKVKQVAMLVHGVFVTEERQEGERP